MDLDLDLNFEVRVMVEGVQNPMLFQCQAVKQNSESDVSPDPLGGTISICDVTSVHFLSLVFANL